MAASVFLSFASKDRKMAETICSALEKRGTKCWLAIRDIHPGENFQEAIVRAIRAAKVMLFVFSANSNNSDEVKKEIALAGQHKLFVIPVRVEDVTPNEAFAYEFATRQWIDLFNDWEASLDQLMMQIDAVTALQAPASSAAAESEDASEQPARRTRRAAAADVAPAAEVTAPPIDTEALYQQGNAYAKAGDYDHAIEQYNEVIRLKPDHAKAMNNRGAAFHAKGDYDSAIADFDRAISLKPDFADAYCNRGAAYHAKADYDRAIRDYTVALQLKPDFASALDNRARAYEQKGVHDMARKDRAAAAALRAGASPSHAPGAGTATPAAPPAKPLGVLGSGDNSRMLMIAGGAVVGLLLVIAIGVSVSRSMHGIGNVAASDASSAASSAASGAADSSASSNADAGTSIADANSKGDAAYQAKDYVGAMHWYLIAANQGDSTAQYDVGLLYDDGYGVAQDYGQALHYYTLAANQGDRDAQNNLGELYYYGHGVAQDYGTAAKWYSLAAAQGEENAEFSLGWLYAHGQGVVQDLPEAHMWMSKSAAQGKQDAINWLAQNPG